MELIPESFSGAVVVNTVNVQKGVNTEGVDFGVGLHNWLMSTNVRYLIFDLQEEKEISPAFIEDMMQLMRRTRIPILFCGVMAKPRAVLQSFDYGSKYEIFNTPDQAIDFLKRRYPGLCEAPPQGVNFGQPIEMARSRLGGKPGEEGDDAETEGDIDEDGNDEDLED